MPLSFEEFSKIWSERFYDEQNPAEHFLTLPQVSDIFPLAILSYIKSVVIDDKISLIELGAGDGDLAKKVIDYSKYFGLNFEKIYLVEKSQKRVENMQKKLGGYKDIVIISSDVSELNLCRSDKSFCLVIANEFFDSLPFSVVKIQKQKALELFVVIDDTDVKVEFREPREEIFYFILKYFSDKVSHLDDFIFEVSVVSERIIKDLSWVDMFIISDYGYRYFCERTKFGSASIHYKFWVERIDFSDTPLAEAKINRFFKRGDISFFVDFEIVEKILEDEGFSSNVSRLSSFIFSTLQNSKEITEKFLKDKKENILSFSNVMSSWGNFFVLTAFKMR